MSFPVFKSRKTSSEIFELRFFDYLEYIIYINFWILAWLYFKNFSVTVPETPGILIIVGPTEWFDWAKISTVTPDWRFQEWIDDAHVSEAANPRVGMNLSALIIAIYRNLRGSDFFCWILLGAEKIKFIIII